jgi:hypothetical protein
MRFYRIFDPLMFVIGGQKLVENCIPKKKQPADAFRAIFDFSTVFRVFGDFGDFFKILDFFLFF